MGLGLRSGSAECREAGSRIHPRGEILDKSLHGGMPSAIEAEEIHFADRFFSRPFLGGDAISGNENAGAIFAEAAVHKDFLSRVIVEKGEKLHDLFIARR